MASTTLFTIPFASVAVPFKTTVATHTVTAPMGKTVVAKMASGALPAAAKFIVAKNTAATTGALVATASKSAASAAACCATLAKSMGVVKAISLATFGVSAAGWVVGIGLAAYLVYASHTQTDNDCDNDKCDSDNDNGNDSDMGVDPCIEPFVTRSPN